MPRGVYPHKIKHGAHRRGHRTQVYCVWSSMIQRCHNPLCKSFKDYGARGIAVCSRWRRSFAYFRADMGPRPPGATLERKRNDMGYAPWNCKWASRKAQMRNRRNNVMIEVGGLRLCAKDWSSRLGGKRSLVQTRLARGWSKERAVTTEVHS